MPEETVPAETVPEDFAPDTTAAPVDRIRLSGIAVTGFHGVLAHERRDGQLFVADVVLHVDTRPAAESDRLDLTVDYGALAQDVAGVLAGPAADLIETVAERIAAVALERPAVVAVDVVVHKPQAPVTVAFGDVAVEIHRDRRHAPSVSRRGQRHAAVEPVVPEQLVAPERPAVLERLVAPVVAEDLLGQVLPVAVPPVLPVAVPPVPPVVEPVPPVVEPVPPVVEPASVPAGLPAHPNPPPAMLPADRMDAVPEAPVDAVIALGSNKGASQEILRDAVATLRDTPGIELHMIAPMARTAPVGGPDQQEFLNTVVLVRTTLSPRALLHVAQGIEEAFGRVRTERWGPRSLDIDLITHGATIGVTDDLELPHARAHERAFVLIPWAHVDPVAVLPGLGGGPVAVLAETAPDRDGIRWMALDWWSAEARP